MMAEGKVARRSRLRREFCRGVGSLATANFIIAQRSSEGKSSV